METIKQNSQLLKKLDRKTQGIQNFYGYDVLNCYEVSYLDTKGMPQQVQVKVMYPSSSVLTVDRVSLRNYLDTFRMVMFASPSEVQKAIQEDLKALLQCHTVVSVFPIEGMAYPYTVIEGAFDLEEVVSSRDFNIETYNKDVELLKVDPRHKGPFYTKSTSLSSLTKSGNKVMNGDLYISIEGKSYPELVSLLQYIVSYRNEAFTEEELVESIYNDLLTKYEPNSLCVCAKYTRRNGVDVNCVRFSDLGSTEVAINILNKEVPNLKTSRQ